MKKRVSFIASEGQKIANKIKGRNLKQGIKVNRKLVISYTKSLLQFCFYIFSYLPIQGVSLNLVVVQNAEYMYTNEINVISTITQLFCVIYDYMNMNIYS